MDSPNVTIVFESDRRKKKIEAAKAYITNSLALKTIHWHSSFKVHLKLPKDKHQTWEQPRSLAALSWWRSRSDNLSPRSAET
jgi:hypothetical protein